MLNSLDGVQKELKEYKKKYEEEHSNVIRLLKCHEDIVQVIKPYLSDFTGINEEGCFDLTLAIKEIMESHESSYVALEDRYNKLLGKYNNLLNKLQNVSNYNY